MFARKLQPKEFWRAGLNMAVAFENSFDYEKELEKSQTAEIDPKEDIYGAFSSEDEPPVASIVMNNMQVRFDGHILKMGGVGGVATLPAHRRTGAIRACMELSLRDLYEKGCALSYLYPFSTAYYRQYGFAPAGQSLRWKVSIRDLQRLPDVGGTVRQFLPGDDLGVLLDIYNRAYAGVNFSCLREVFSKNLQGGKPLADKRWIFVWYDVDGTPGGFIVGTRARNTLHCVPEFSSNDAMIFTGAKALIGLLNFVYSSFIANFEDIEFVVPDHMNLTALLPEVHDINCRPVLNGMARAIDVEALLRLCRCRGEGRIVLKITDGIIPENNDIFMLDFAPGRENIVERTSGPAGIEMDVGNLSVLLGGCRDAGSIGLTPDIKVNEPDLNLSQIFYRKPCHNLDLF